LPKKSFVLILLCLSAITAYAGVKDGLYLHLPLNEGSGTPKDVSNNKFKTELSKAAPKWVDGGHAKVKKALEFDGTTNSVKIDMEGQGKDINSHYDPAKGLSICAWVKVIKTATDKHGQTRQPIVMKGAGGQWEFALLVYDNLAAGMSVWTCPGSGVSEPSGGKLGAGWHFQCGTFSIKEGVKVYLDADKKPVAQAESGADAPCDKGKRPVFLAHREDGQFLNAAIAQVMIWDRVISLEEIASAMAGVDTAVDSKDKLATTWSRIKVLD